MHNAGLIIYKIVTNLNFILKNNENKIEFYPRYQPKSENLYLIIVS